MDLSNRSSHSWLTPILQNLDQRGLTLKSLEQRLMKLLNITQSELRMIMGAVLLSSFIILLTQGSDSEKKDIKRPIEISTFIPAGHVLVPIRLKNFESIDSILGPFGIVDLFIDFQNGASKPIVKNIKLLRAPKNPSLFAVLAPQDQASRIIQADEKGLYAVIKNRSEGGTEFVKSSPERSRITYAAEEK